MPDRPDFPIPDIINPPKRRCIQIDVPDDAQHMQVLAGLIYMLTQWYNWQRDDQKRGIAVANVWKKVYQNIDWSSMSCCPEPTARRYNAAGELEVSYDGGQTWQPDPQGDPRVSAPTLPPLPGADGDDKKCAGANNVVNNLKNHVDRITGDASGWASLTALIGLLMELAVAIGVTAAFPPLTILLMAFAAALLVFGREALAAAMTTEVWDEFRCTIYCHLDDTGAIDATGVEAIKAEINDKWAGVANVYLWNTVQTIGAVGLTNFARTSTEPHVSCEECQCGDLNCGFISTPTENKFVWTEATEKIDPTTFTGAINFQQSAGGNVMFGSSGTTLAAYHEFEEACYITTVDLYTSGRPNSSSVTVGYKATPGGAWINTGTQSFPTWASGVPKTFTINAAVYAIQVKSINGNVANNNFTTIVVGDPTP